MDTQYDLEFDLKLKITEFLMTKEGFEIFTKSKKNYNQPPYKIWLKDTLEKKLKKEKNTPALVLTAKRDIEDKVEGLSVADDYLTKPFEFEELIARVKALYRRSHNLNDNI